MALLQDAILGNPGICEGRLTLESGVPISTTDQSAKTTVYFTPMLGFGSKVLLFNGTVWVPFLLAEVSLALGTLTSGKNYDVFLYDNAGTRTLELSAAWSSDSARSDALVLLNGVYVKSGATTRLHVGTIRTISTTATSDTLLFRGVWNRYNRVERQGQVTDLTDSWTYKTNTWRQANGATANKFEFVVGDTGSRAEAMVVATIGLQGNTGSLAASAAVGADSITATSGVHSAGFNGTATFQIAPVSGSFRSMPALGYHYFAWLEFGIAGTSTLFYGDNAGSVGTADIQSGLTASVWA